MSGKREKALKKMAREEHAKLPSKLQKLYSIQDCYEALKAAWRNAPKNPEKGRRS